LGQEEALELDKMLGPLVAAALRFIIWRTHPEAPRRHPQHGEAGGAVSFGAEGLKESLGAAAMGK
jgi:hypothetical protein